MNIFIRLKADHFMTKTTKKIKQLPIVFQITIISQYKKSVLYIKIPFLNQMGIRKLRSLDQINQMITLQQLANNITQLNSHSDLCFKMNSFHNRNHKYLIRNLT